MRFFFVITTAIMLQFVCQSSFAQVKGKADNATTENSPKKYKGIVLAKSWAKSTQSYCAQGSEYFVLKVGKQEFVLENQTDINLADYKGKKLSFLGYEKTRIISAKDDNSQQPVEMMLDAKGNAVRKTDFTCTVLIIQKKI